MLNYCWSPTSGDIYLYFNMLILYILYTIYYAYLLDIQNFRGSSATGCNGMNMVILPQLSFEQLIFLWGTIWYAGNSCLLTGHFFSRRSAEKKGYFIVGRKNILWRSQSGRVWVIEKEGTWEGWVETNVIFRLEGTNMKKLSQLWLAVGSLPHFHGDTRCLNMPQW